MNKEILIEQELQNEREQEYINEFNDGSLDTFIDENKEDLIKDFLENKEEEFKDFCKSWFNEFNKD